MASRGTQQLKDYRVHINSIKEWVKYLEDPRILVVEVYNSIFGQCTSILPTIQNIMLQIDDSEHKIVWASINVGKVIQDTKAILEEEAKKKRDMDESQRRMMTDEEIRRAKLRGTASYAADASLDDFSRSAIVDTKINEVTVPKLEKWANFDSPKSVFLIFQDGEIRYEVHYPNPPKLTKIVTSLAKGVVPDPTELYHMDFHPDPTRTRKRKSKRRLQQEEAAKQRKLAERERILRQVEDPVRLRVSVALQDHLKPDTKPLAFPVVALFARPPPPSNLNAPPPTPHPITGEFTQFIAATEPSKTPLSPVFTTAFDLDPSLLRPADLEAALIAGGAAVPFAASPSEFLVCVFDVEAGTDIGALTPAQMEETLAGTVVIDVAQVFQSTGATEHHTHANIAPSSPPPPPPAFAGVPNVYTQDTPAAPLPVFASFDLTPTAAMAAYSAGSLLCNARLTRNQGTPRQYNIRVGFHNLPLAAMDSSEAALVAVVSLERDNAIAFAPVGTTEIRRGTCSPVFDSGVLIAHGDRDLRVKVSVYDAEERDPLHPTKGLIAWGLLPLSAFASTLPTSHIPHAAHQAGSAAIALAAPEDLGEDGVPVASVSLKYLPVGCVSDIISTTLRNVQGEPIPESLCHLQAHVVAPPRPKFGFTTGAAKVRVNARVHGIERQDWHNTRAQPIIAAYQRDVDSQKWTRLVGVTERCAVASDPLAPVVFLKDLVLDAPVDDDDERGQIKLVCYDVLSKDELQPHMGTHLCECILDLYSLLRKHNQQDTDLPCTDITGRQLPRASVTVNVADAGHVATADVGFHASNIPYPPSVVPATAESPGVGIGAVVVCSTCDSEGKFTIGLGHTEVVYVAPPTIAAVAPASVAAAEKSEESESKAVDTKSKGRKGKDGKDKKDEKDKKDDRQKEKEKAEEKKEEKEDISTDKDKNATPTTAAPIFPAPASPGSGYATSNTDCFSVSWGTLVPVGLYSNLPLPLRIAVYAVNANQQNNHNWLSTISEEDILCDVVYTMRDNTERCVTMAAMKGPEQPIKDATLRVHVYPVETVLFEPVEDSNVTERSAVMDTNTQIKFYGGLVQLEKKAAPVETPAATLTARDMWLALSCANLPQVQDKKPLDPLVVVYKKASDKSGAYSIVMQTEWIHEETSPTFQTLVQLHYVPGESNTYRFTIFDVGADGNISEEDIVASVKIDLADLLAAANGNESYTHTVTLAEGETPDAPSTLTLAMVPEKEAVDRMRLLAEAEEAAAAAQAEESNATAMEEEAAVETAEAHEDNNGDASLDNVEQISVAMRVALRGLPVSETHSLVVVYRAMNDVFDLVCQTDLVANTTDPEYPNVLESNVVPVESHTSNIHRFTVFAVRPDAEDLSDEDVLATADLNLLPLLQGNILAAQLVFTDGSTSDAEIIVTPSKVDTVEHAETVHASSEVAPASEAVVEAAEVVVAAEEAHDAVEAPTDSTIAVEGAQNHADAPIEVAAEASEATVEVAEVTEATVAPVAVESVTEAEAVEAEAAVDAPADSDATTIADEASPVAVPAEGAEEEAVAPVAVEGAVIEPVEAGVANEDAVADVNAVAADTSADVHTTVADADSAPTAETPVNGDAAETEVVEVEAPVVAAVNAEETTPSATEANDAPVEVAAEAPISEVVVEDTAASEVEANAAEAATEAAVEAVAADGADAPDADEATTEATVLEDAPAEASTEEVAPVAVAEPEEGEAAASEESAPAEEEGYTAVPEGQSAEVGAEVEAAVGAEDEVATEGAVETTDA